MAASPLIVALDYPNPEPALDLARRLEPAHCRLKVGNELFTRGGPALVQGLQDLGFEVFLDLKYHDIPNTVAAACRAAADLGVWMVNVHALGGRRMLAAARQALPPGPGVPLLIGVTVLTSQDQADLDELGLAGTPQTWVGRLAGQCREQGLDGVVCSAAEAPALRAAPGEGLCLVTPGIRPPGAAADDQRRTVTPAQAVANGASYLVVGRPVRQAPDPAAAVIDLLSQLD